MLAVFPLYQHPVCLFESRCFEPLIGLYDGQSHNSFKVLRLLKLCKTKLFCCLISYLSTGYQQIYSNLIPAKMYVVIKQMKDQ